MQVTAIVKTLAAAGLLTASVTHGAVIERAGADGALIGRSQALDIRGDLEPVLSRNGAMEDHLTKRLTAAGLFGLLNGLQEVLGDIERAIYKLGRSVKDDQTVAPLQKSVDRGTAAAFCSLSLPLLHLHSVLAAKKASPSLVANAPIQKVITDIAAAAERVGHGLDASKLVEAARP
ncbi:hypothetical protein V8E36_004857 [Tilletia maclaganii]